MRLFLTAMLGSMIAGYAVGGRLGNLERLRLRWWGLAPIGLAMQLVPLPWSGEGARAVALGLLVASYPMLIAFAVRHPRLAGPGDVLMPVADVIPVGPPINQVMSAGDVVAYGGIIWLIVSTQGLAFDR
ncbi:MAG: hypothetical protein KatS3mg013_0494 [Actinomycetota bacterium]|nr:MAG: hypothetical protein KatS3mg013_0494 [Actinomycetota bacterium]